MCGDAVLVPARAEYEVPAPDGPAVLQRLIAGGGVEDDVVDPLAVLRRCREVGAVVDAAPVDADTGRAQQLGASGVGDGVDAVLAVLQDEDVPVAVDALAGVVEGQRRLAPVGPEAVEGLLDERLREGAGIGLRDRGRGGVGVALGEREDAHDEGGCGKADSDHGKSGHDAVLSGSTSR